MAKINKKFNINNLVYINKYIYICNIKMKQQLKSNKMNTTSNIKGGYQGETYESLIGQRNYLSEMLSNDLANWERKEYQIALEEVEFKISEIENF